MVAVGKGGGVNSRLGANDRGAFSRGVTQDYDTGQAI